MDQNNFKYSLDFIRRFNALIYQGEPLSHQKIFGKYNVWIFFQNRIFFNDLREFAKEGKLPLPIEHSLKTQFQNIILSLFSLLVSSLSVIWAAIFKREVLVYSIDRTNSNVLINDARLDSVYQYLKISHTPYLEFLHTTFEFGFVKRFFQRMRGVFYIKSIDTLFNLGVSVGLIKLRQIDINSIDLSSFTKEEGEYARQLLSKYLNAIDLAIFRVRVLRKVLQWIRVDTLLTIDNTRDYWELVLASSMNNIKVYAFQHGHFTKYHVGWLNDGTFDGVVVQPDKLFVWSDFWKKELIRLGTYFSPESIEVGGLKSVLSLKHYKSGSEYIGVMIPYEVDSDKVEIKKYMDIMLACGNIKILFKLRTDLSADKQIKEYSLSEGYNHNLKFVSDIKECLDEISVVAGTYSTFLYDMVAYEIPIVLLETNSDFGEGLVINRLADSVKINNVCEGITKAALTKEEILEDRKEKLFGKNTPLMYDTVQRLCSRK